MRIGTHNLQATPGAGAGLLGAQSRRGYVDTRFAIPTGVFNQPQAHDAAQDRNPVGRDEKAMQAARSLVSIGLIQPLLAQARKDPFRSDLFHGGQAEDVFGAQLDTIFAERMTKSMGVSLIDAVYQRIVNPGIAPGTAGHGRVDTQG